MNGRASQSSMPREWHLDLSEAAGGSIVYAVGDVHGVSDLLHQLLASIEADARGRGARAIVLFLGDLVNRGPDTRGVLETVLAGPKTDGDQWFAIRGNHEQALLDALHAKDAFERFVKKGGLETLLSYGARKKDLTPEGMRGLIPAGHIRFLEALPLTCRVNDLLFVHAGLQPGRPLADQTSETLMNIREPFLSEPHGQPLLVVHGHVPSQGAPVQKPWRICLDTGAVLTGVLTAGVFEPGVEVRFLQART